MLNGLLNEVKSLQEKVDIKLLAHLSFAFKSSLHLFPLFAASHPSAYLIGPEEDKCEDVEIGKVNLFVSVLEEFLCYVQFEGHQHEFSHEYHEPQYSTDQSTHIREKPVYFSERSFVSVFNA